MAVPSLVVGGVDVTLSCDFHTLRVGGSGMADSETLDFELADPTNSLSSVVENATVTLTESGGALTFGGFAQIVRPNAQAVGRRLEVRCISKGVLLDRLLVVSDTRSAGESDKTRIQYLLTTYGTGLSTTYTSIATVNASMPAQSFENMSLRAALEAVAALASTSARFYVDAAGKLHYYASVPTAAPYAIRVGTPGGGEIAPDEIGIERDASAIINAYWVVGANSTGSGWVTDATSIAAWGRREAFLQAPDSDTASKRNSYGNAALALTKDPTVRGTFTTTSPRDGWAAEQTLTVTSTQHGLSAATFAIQKVTTSYLVGTGDRSYLVEFGGALPRFSSSGSSPASLPAGVLTSGSLSITPFASSIRPVVIVGSLPTLPDPVYPAGATVVLTTDGKLYRNVANVWVKNLDGADLDAASVSGTKLVANTVTAAQIAAGTITANEIATDTITAGQIAAGAIATSELAAGAVTADKISAQSIDASKIRVGGVNGDLLVNGSFEEGTAAIRAGYVTTSADTLGWTIQTATQVQFGTSSATRGKYRCLIQSTTGTQAFCRVEQFIPVRAGRRYLMSGWLSHGATAGSSIAPSVNLATYDRDLVQVSGSALALTHSPATGTTPTFYSGEYTIPNDGTVAYVRVDCRFAGTAALNEIAVFDDVAFTLVPLSLTNGPAEVVINASGIAVTNGKITVTNAGATVIIDGTSNMFKIAATGTSTITPPNTGATTTSSVDLGDLGLGIAQAWLGYIAVNGSVWADSLPLTLWNVSTGVANHMIDAYLEYNQPSSGRSRFRVAWSARDATWYGTGNKTFRYYVLKEAAL